MQTVLFIVKEELILSKYLRTLLVALLGNVIVIGLEGMIVAIQVVRLQYYEFFSKFFSETGKEFSPFVFVYRNSAVE